MIAIDVNRMTVPLLAFVTGCLLIPGSSGAQAPTGQPSTIPPKVMSALHEKFPRAQIGKWTPERERNKEVYDIEFTQDGKKFEADIFADGTIDNWEKEIAQSDLPDAVRAVLERKYATATTREVMAITAVANGKEALAGYEIVLKTRGGKNVEITLAPDGRVLEGPGVEK